MKPLQLIDLETAVNQIQRAREGFEGVGSPFFFLVGAGISHPPIPLASEIIEHCKVTAEKNSSAISLPLGEESMDKYSHWFQQAYPQPIDRQKYLRDLILDKAISAANFRLAHLMLESTITNIVVTTNFDDFLSQALTIFGKHPIVCDHPNTVERIHHEREEIQIVHVHGTHWFYDCCNLHDEIKNRSQPSGHSTSTMAALLDRILSLHSPLVIGYSGWKDDVIMAALKRRLQNSLPYNLYWFCYRREDIDSLPSWLIENHQVYFVCPPAQESSRPSLENDEGNSTKKLTKEALPEDIEDFSGKNDDKSTLSAKKVFNKLIQKFKLEAPELTKDPLGFYAKHLRKSLLFDDPEKGDSDIYLIGNVIDQIEQQAMEIETRKHEKSKNKEKIINHKIEELRDAIRRSQYSEAIRLATVIDQSELSSQQLRELMETMWSAANELNDNTDEELSNYDLIINITETLLGQNIYDSTLPARIAQTLFNKGVTLRVLNRNEDAISVYDEVVRRFGDSTEMAIQKWVAKVLVNKGVTLGVLNRNKDAISVYDEVIRRFGDSTEMAIQEMVAKALVNKGVTLRVLNRNEDAISVYDEVVRRFGDSTEMAIQEMVAYALVNKGLRLGVLNRNKDAISVCDEVVRRFGNSTEMAIQEMVAYALYNKGVRLGVLNRNKDAISVYDEVVRRFGDSTEKVTQVLVAKALVNKGGTFGVLNRNEDAISACDEVVRRFGDSTEKAIQESIVYALFNKGEMLGVLNRNKDAISVYDEVVRWFGNSTETVIREMVAKAQRKIIDLTSTKI